ncbi:MAG: hypothetical protein WCK48_02480 [bacterium]
MINVIKIVVPAVVTFFLGILITPFFTHYFYKYKMWKKSARTEAGDITTDDFAKVHNTKGELSTPRPGGIIVWFSVILTVFIIYLLSLLFPGDLTHKLNFFSRSQTLLPIAVFILGSLIGLADDLLQVFSTGSYARDNIANRKVKIGCIFIIGVIVSYWFYFKLAMTTIHIPFWYDIDLGIMIIPFFIMVMFAVFSTSIIDGIDGLSGGVMASIFTAYSAIAFFQNQIDIATLCAVIAGGTLAFLWFNIPPARFYMSETGMIGLTVVLSVIAFLTNTVLLLPIIALPLVATSLSAIIQMISYKYFNKHRVFRVAPLHHHFEAIGWSKEKVVMRYWIVSVVCAIIGVILSIVS